LLCPLCRIAGMAPGVIGIDAGGYTVMADIPSAVRSTNQSCPGMARKQNK